MIGWNPLSWWLELLRTGQIPTQDDETPPDERGAPETSAHREESDPDLAVVTGEHDLQPVPYQLQNVGAWVGAGSYGSNSAIEATLDFAKKVGLGRLDVIVNDHSAKRAPRDFGTFNKSRIETFCLRALDAGFEVHLMTWCMPHEKYLRGMVDQLGTLAGNVKVLHAKGREICSIQLDAEEPWTHAKNPMPWAEAAQIVIDGFGENGIVPIPYGVTAIGWASGKKLRPLMAGAHYGVPQCYSTARNNHNPATMTGQMLSIWRDRFPRGPDEAPLIFDVGLAAYRQSGRPGYSKERFMREAFNAAIGAQARSVVFWSLRWIRNYRSTANIVAKLAHEHAAHRAGADVA